MEFVGLHAQLHTQKMFGNTLYIKMSPNIFHINLGLPYFFGSIIR